MKVLVTNIVGGRVGFIGTSPISDLGAKEVRLKGREIRGCWKLVYHVMKPLMPLRRDGTRLHVWRRIPHPALTACRREENTIQISNVNICLGCNNSALLTHRTDYQTNVLPVSADYWDRKHLWRLRKELESSKRENRFFVPMPAVPGRAS